MNKWYKADSIRVKANGYDGIGVRFGRFAAEVREDSIRVIESDEPESDPGDEDKYGCVVAWGSVCWAYPTVEAAFAAGEAYMTLAGWTTDYDEARAAAIALAKSRHERHMALSTNYARRYGESGEND